MTKSAHMTKSVWSLDGSSGDLLVCTATAGPAARMGHRLTIGMTDWQASVQWRGKTPVTAELTVSVDSLKVLRGEGGVTPLTAPERAVARANALRSLESGTFPQIRFSSEEITKTDDGYRLAGTVEIHGKSRPQNVDLAVREDAGRWEMSARVPITQSDFGVKPYSLMMGALKVADEVTVEFTGSHPR